MYDSHSTLISEEAKLEICGPVCLDPDKHCGTGSLGACTPTQVLHPTEKKLTQMSWLSLLTLWKTEEFMSYSCNIKYVFPLIPYVA